jgi:hypothetical protein
MTPKQYHRLERRTEEFQARAQGGDAPSNETPMDEGGEVTATR